MLHKGLDDVLRNCCNQIEDYFWYYLMDCGCCIGGCGFITITPLTLDKFNGVKLYNHYTKHSILDEQGNHRYFLISWHEKPHFIDDNALNTHYVYFQKVELPPNA